MHKIYLTIFVKKNYSLENQRSMKYLGYNDLLKAIGEEEQRHEQFSKLSNQVMTLNNSISQQISDRVYQKIYIDIENGSKRKVLIPQESRVCKT